MTEEDRLLFKKSSGNIDREIGEKAELVEALEEKHGRPDSVDKD